jgi:hypothetical protein
MEDGGCRAITGTAKDLPEIIPEYSVIEYSTLQPDEKISPPLFVSLYFSQLHPASIGLMSHPVKR